VVLPSSFFGNSLQELCNMNKSYCGFVVAEITERFRRNMFLGTSLCHLYALCATFIQRVKQSTVRVFDSEETSLLVYDLVSIGK
jgi:hypothetical protein